MSIIQIQVLTSSPNWEMYNDQKKKESIQNLLALKYM